MGDREVDIAGVILGLVSGNGRFITGQTFCVDGGAWLAKPPNEHAENTDIHSGRHQTASADATDGETFHGQIEGFKVVVTATSAAAVAGLGGAAVRRIVREGSDGDLDRTGRRSGRRQRSP